LHDVARQRRDIVGHMNSADARDEAASALGVALASTDLLRKVDITWNCRVDDIEQCPQGVHALLRGCP
jgi:hypothetical protein